MTVNKKAVGVTRIIGLADDARDGHTRISRGSRFRVWMGSEETHEAMSHICREIEQRLAKAGRKLEDLTEDELLALAAEIES